MTKKSSVYHEFDSGDLFESVIRAAPEVNVFSGSGGWGGASGTSGSLSLYSGVRSRYDVKESDFSTSGISIYPIDQLDSNSIDKVNFVSGSYPSTGSIRFVSCSVAETDNPSLITDTTWFKEHWTPIELLYEYYKKINTNYFTGSYDYYMLGFYAPAGYNEAGVTFSSSLVQLLSGSTSATLEALVKMTTPVASMSAPSVLFSTDYFSLYVDTTKKLKVWGPSYSVSSSIDFVDGVWKHVACVLSNNTASLYIDATKVGEGPFIDPIWSANSIFRVGYNADIGDSFVGFMHETRVWNRALSATEISASYNSTILNSGSANGLIHYARYNDGPLSIAHSMSRGQGVFDHSPYAIHGQFYNLGTYSTKFPTWQPCDDIRFTTKKTKITIAPESFKIVHVPSMFYGRQIATGSVKIECKAYDSASLVRVLNDDGRGSLYVSGSMCRQLSNEDYEGVKWNKVGNVFYSEGIIIITDPSLHDLGRDDTNNTVTSMKLFDLSFRGATRTITKTFMCRFDPSDANSSNNITFSSWDDNGTPEIVGDDRLIAKKDDLVTYVTAVGLYDDDHNLVAIAKLAQPIRKREKDKINVRLKMDF